MNNRFRTLRNAHFFDVKIKEGKKEITVSAPNQRLVMQCLFEYLGENSICWPSQLTLSCWCGFTSPKQMETYQKTGKKPSLTTVKRVLKALEQNHYIETERLKLSEPGDRKTQNTYKIVWSNVAGINNQQTEFFFDSDQSPTEPDQSSTTTDQSPTEPDQSPTRGPHKPQYQTPSKNLNPKPHGIGQKKDFQIGFDRSDPDFENKSILTIQISDSLIESFRLKTPVERKEATLHAAKVANSEWDAGFVHEAIAETLKTREGKPRPPNGLAKLNYFKAIMNRKTEEFICQ